MLLEPKITKLPLLIEVSPIVFSVCALGADARKHHLLVLSFLLDFLLIDYRRSGDSGDQKQVAEMSNVSTAYEFPSLWNAVFLRTQSNIYTKIPGFLTQAAKESKDPNTKLREEKYL